MKIKYWETYYWKKAAKVVAVSERDADLMKQLVPGLKVEVIPSGVGDDLIDDVPIHYSKNILFQGNYAWLQNIEAARILAREIFPLILKELPDARLVISGQYASKIFDLKTEKIDVFDTAIDDIESVKKNFRENGILIAPLYGPGGTRLKILGAMAAKLPVVTTKVGIEGIDAVNGESALFGETPEELAELAIKLLNNKKLYQKIAVNARKLIEKKYTYEAIAGQLNKVYWEAVDGKVDS
jgi:polysaccharide biosynthesis protein PslH